MARSVLFAVMLIWQTAVAQAPAASNAEKERAANAAQSEARHTQSGPGVVAVDPNQPYRPIPANRAQTRETIFEFYLKALNPRQIKWGEEIDRRLGLLVEQSVLNPYFRFSALQMALILVLILICWLWWDKMQQIKRVAAECLTDAINAKRLVEHKALEAISQHNRHIEMCNRVIENQESGLATGSGSEDLRLELREAQTQLAAERAKSASLAADLKSRADIQGKLESRIQQLERTMLDRQGEANAELVARLQRAEAELGNQKAQRN